MRIKRYIVFASLWLLIMTAVATSKQKSLEFIVYFDQATKQSAEIKNEVLHRYANLMRGVHEESEITMIKNNLDQFMWQDDMDAQWHNNALEITIGAGDGMVIHGDLDAQEVCLPQVKTKSLFAEWFGN